MRAFLSAFLVFVLSCGRVPPPAGQARTAPAAEPALPSEEEWLARLEKSPGDAVDLVEAMSVLSRAPSPSAIRRAMDPVVKEVKGKIAAGASPEDRIAALNGAVLPWLAGAERGELAWLYGALSSDLGPCVVNAILYQDVADQAGLPLEMVQIPAHFYLRHREGERIRNIEVTDQGQEVTEEQYRVLLMRNPKVKEPLAELPEAFAKSFPTLPRRWAVAMLLCQRTEGRPEAERLRKYEAAARIAPDWSHALKVRAAAHLDRGEPGAAEELFARAIGLAPHLPSLYSGRGVARQRQGKLAGSLQDFDEAVRLCPRYAKYRYDRAMTLRKMGRYPEAVEASTEAVALQPLLAEARRFRAELLQQALQEHGRALEDYTFLIDRGLHEPSDLHNRGICHLKREENEKALEDLTKAAAASPGAATAWRDRGLCHGILKRYKEAVEDLTRAIELDPKDAVAYRLRSQAHAMLGDDAGFQRDFRKIKELEGKR